MTEEQKFEEFQLKICNATNEIISNLTDNPERTTIMLYTVTGWFRHTLIPSFEASLKEDPSDNELIDDFLKLQQVSTILYNLTSKQLHERFMIIKEVKK